MYNEKETMDENCEAPRIESIKEIIMKNSDMTKTISRQVDELIFFLFGQHREDNKLEEPKCLEDEICQTNTILYDINNGLSYVLERLGAEK